MDDSKSNQVRILSVFSGSPAAKAGLKKGDILISVDDRPISSYSDYIDATAERGAEQKITVKRNEEILEKVIRYGSKRKILQHVPDYATIVADMEKDRAEQ